MTKPKKPTKPTKPTKPKSLFDKSILAWGRLLPGGKGLAPLLHLTEQEAKRCRFDRERVVRVRITVVRKETKR